MNLTHGQSKELSRSGGTWVTIERSGNIIRYVRHTASGFVVFKTVRV